MTLSDAAWTFAPANLRAEAGRKVVPEIPLIRPDATQEEAKAAFKPLIKGLVDFVASIGLPEMKMREQLLSKLRDGIVVAFGIETRPNLSRREVRISSNMFDDSPNIFWSKNVIENFGIRYEHLRLYKDEHYSSAPEGSDKTAPPSSAVIAGRPSKNVKIEKVITSLATNRVPLQTMPRKMAYDAIRNEAVAQGCDISIGFSDPVIQRALLAKFGRRIGSK